MCFTFSTIRLIVYGPLAHILGPFFHHGNCVGTSEHPALLASSENSSRKFTTCNQFSGQHWAAMSEKINEYSIVHIGSPSHCPFAPAFTGHRWIPCTKVSDAELWYFSDLHLNKRLNKQSWGWWFKTPSCPLWRHYNGFAATWVTIHKSLNASCMDTAMSLPR